MSPAQPKLLIVEDDEAIRTQLKYALRERYALTFADNRTKALALLSEIHPDVVSLDLGLPPHADTAEEGLQALEDILRAAPATKVIVVTGNGDRANARRAVELGAFDYLSKPIDLTEYETVLHRSTYLQALETENGRQAAEAEAAVRFEEIIGSTPRMREIFAMLSLVAKTDVTLLVQGESGTGKELVARAVHHKSRRKNAPFVPINCGAIPESLLESELFGHEKGAYTGAHIQRKGKLEQADNGTVFLDEIAEMSLPLQVKLLRFLQERQIERLGGQQRIPVDTRVIAATNKDLKTEIAAGRFREDLFFRLSVVTVTLRVSSPELSAIPAAAFVQCRCSHRHRPEPLARQHSRARECRPASDDPGAGALHRAVRPRDRPGHETGASVAARGAQPGRAAGRGRCVDPDEGQYQPRGDRARYQSAGAARPARQASHRQQGAALGRGRALTSS